MRSSSTTITLGRWALPSCVHRTSLQAQASGKSKDEAGRIRACGCRELPRSWAVSSVTNLQRPSVAGVSDIEIRRQADTVVAHREQQGRLLGIRRCRATSISPRRSSGKACFKALEISSLTIRPQGMALLIGRHHTVGLDLASAISFWRRRA